MKLVEFEIDTAHTVRAAIALGACSAIATIATQATEPIIVFGTTLLITAISVLAIMEPRRAKRN